MTTRDKSAAPDAPSHATTNAAARIRLVLDLDRMVHEPARLVILSVLASAESVEFKFLESLTGLTKGNLSSHTAKLESAGYLKVHKSFRGRTPSTTFQITPRGLVALTDYRELLQTMAIPPPKSG
ncbi:MAG: transcriptional regulator [Tepidisphaeraceae bacterium]